MQCKIVIFTLLAWLTMAIAAPTTASTTSLTSAANTSIPFLSKIQPSEYQAACATKNMAAFSAIVEMCRWDTMPNIQKEGTVRVEGSDDYTIDGISYAVQILWVCGESPGKGDGEGGPGGYVAYEDCWANFWSMCANGDQYGGGVTVYHGDQDCQEWTIPTFRHEWQGRPELYWGPFLLAGDGGLA